MSLLRENHSGMETDCILDYLFHTLLLRENHSGMETRTVELLAIDKLVA